MNHQWFVLLSTFFAIDGAQTLIRAEESEEVYRWECVNGQCEKYLINEENLSEALSLGVCKMYCNDFGNMWPQPTGNFSLGNNIQDLNRNSIDVLLLNQDGPAVNLISAATTRFKDLIQKTIPEDSKINEGGNSMVVNINVEDLNVADLTLETDESYTLELFTLPDSRINVAIESKTFFGARHALESLVQFVIFDDIRLKLLIPQALTIVDKPVYPHRGISLDTARNYYTIETIKRTIDGMSATKLNRFHWHMIDTHSFSFVSKTYPRLTKLGAISPSKVYTEAQMIDLVQYGIERGVKIIPEFDAPAHVGEGWQETDMTVCFKANPWMDYCVEPPCGQFDPTKDELYPMLEGIYSDMFDIFKPDLFYMGGDEVSFSCWNSSSNIQAWMLNRGWNLDITGFLKLWDYFQSNALARVIKVNGDKKIPIVLWTSTLTELEHIDEYLGNENYIIQIWTQVDDPQIAGLLDKGYRLIISNYDALYLDCGFGAWVGDGHNWCSPYVGWQTVYNNSPAKMAGDKSNLIIGGEAILWSEQSDTSTLDNRIWPRAGAYAERLWAEPNTGWEKAERRMLHMRERLVKIGLSADSIQPEWCYKNEGYCYL